MDREIAVGEAVRRKVRAEGGEAERWLTDLPELIAGLERDWGIEVGGTLQGGTAAFVAEAVRADGSPAVLKLAMPAESEGRVALGHELRTLLLVDGRGCVRVLEHDLARGAVLLERLGRQLVELGLPVPQQLRIICGVVRRVWDVPPDASLPSLATKGPWFEAFIEATWEELDRPCARQVVDRAVFYAERRTAAFDEERAVLTHGDAHAWNTLEDLAAHRPGAFRLVDPDGLIAEPEYDLAIPMREFNEELLAADALPIGRERARVLAAHTGRDAQKIWEWGFVERVSTGLYSMQLGDVDGGAEFLRIAERWCD